MADLAGLPDSPRQPSVWSASPPRGRKRSSVDGAWPDGQQWKRDRRDPGRDSALQPASDSAMAGPSQPRDVNTAGPSLEDRVSQLSSIVADLIVKLDRRSPETMPRVDSGDFSGFVSIGSAGSEDGEVREPAADPLADLDGLADPRVALDDADFHRALEELEGHFHCQEKKGEPLSDRLAGILDESLRRRPTSEGVKTTCSKVRLPSNVPNLTVPATNAAISKALSVGGRLIDARLFFTNGLLSKALVPVAQCLSDIVERKGKPVDAYLDGLNNCVRLLTSAVCYLNQLRKEVARIHVNDTALAELCRWDCEVGTAELFPFDVIKKCEEIHRARRLGRPSFRPYRSGGPRQAAASHQAPRRAPPPRHSRFRSRPFLGQRPPPLRGNQQHRPAQ